MRLIDADELIARLDELRNKAKADDFYLGVAWYSTFAQHVALSPAVDAVPVVRCKDCKYHDTNIACMLIEGDWFCADGERREDA